MNNSQAEQVARDVYNAVFEILDSIAEVDGMTAGHIATKAEMYTKASLSHEDMRLYSDPREAHPYTPTDEDWAEYNEYLERMGE